MPMMHPVSRRTRALRFLVLLTAAASGLCQEENEPYFALSSNRTFSSKGKAAVELSAYNVESLEFRVYRVNDPLKFFQTAGTVANFEGRRDDAPLNALIKSNVREVFARVELSTNPATTKSSSMRIDP